MFEEVAFHLAMRMSGTPRHPRACLPMLYLVLAASHSNSLGFVQSASWERHRTIEGQVNMRSARKRQEGKAQQFTVAIKRAPTPRSLIETLDWVVDGPVFDDILASAAYTQLVAFKRRRSLHQSDWDSPVLLRMHTRVQDMVQQDDLDARGFANILWTLGQLSQGFSIPAQLLDALVKSVPAKVKGMDEQALSNILWASARLQGAKPVVLEMVPEFAGQIPNKAKDMIPQQLSNCLLAVLQLEMVVPEVLEIVPAIVGEIPAKIQGMKPQEMSNSLEALVLLRDSVPEVAGFLATDGRMDDIARFAAEHLDAALPQVTGKDLSFAAPVVVWACAKVGIFHHGLLVSIAQRLRSCQQMSALPNFGVGALLWSY